MQVGYVGLVNPIARGYLPPAGPQGRLRHPAAAQDDSVACTHSSCGAALHGSREMLR